MSNVLDEISVTTSKLTEVIIFESKHNCSPCRSREPNVLRQKLVT